MGCILSVLSLILKIITTAVKAVVNIVVLVVKFLIKLGLLFPLIYACVGVGLLLAGSEVMVAGTTGFWVFHAGFVLLTIYCLWRSLKKAMLNHNAKYDENGKRIRK